LITPRLPSLTRWVAGPARAVARQLARELSEDRVTGLAAETAFFIVLSVFPGLVMLASALGSLDLVLGSDVAAEGKRVVVEFLRRILTERASQTVEVVQDLFIEQRSGLITISLLFSLWALMRGFAAVIRALNLAYDIEEARTWIRQRLVAAVLSVGSVAVGALMLAAFVAGPLLGGGQALAEALGLGDTFASAWAIVRWPIAFGLVVLWAAAVYLFAPNRKSHLSQELPGAALTAVFGLAASAALNLYVRLAAAANPVLGSLGGGMILLLWLYLLSLGLLIGGELNAVLRDRSRNPLLSAPRP
jgi:membrane protein